MLPILKVIVIVIIFILTKSNCNCNYYICFQEVIGIAMVSKYNKSHDKSLRIALSLCLGATIVVEHTCVCGATVDSYGTHGLSSHRSGGCLPCHASVNETIRHALVSGSIPAVLEPIRVCHDDGKEPDGMSLIPWRRDLPLLWDFTCSDTLASSHLPLQFVMLAGWQIRYRLIITSFYMRGNTINIQIIDI